MQGRTITRHNITFQVEKDDKVYNVFIPFIEYNVFKDIILIFSNLYPMIKDKTISLEAFTMDYEAHIDNIIKKTFDVVEHEAIKAKYANFIHKSMAGAMVLSSDGVECSFDKFISDDSLENEEFYNNTISLYIFFYVMYRYVKVKYLVTEFKGIYILQTYMEYRDYFMKSLSQETFIKEKTDAHNATITLKKT